MAEDEKTFSAKQVATRIGTDARQLRKFFRDSGSGYDAVGQGGRYDFPESRLPEIKEKFDLWASTKTRRNRVKTTTVRGSVTHAPSLPRPRTERAVNRPIPRIMLSAEEIARLDEDGREMLKAVGMDDKGFEPDYEADGYTGPHNELQPIIDHLERSLEDDDEYFEDGFFDDED